MRIGEIENILLNAVNDEYLLVLNSEPVFNGQAYSLQNYGNIMAAIKIASEELGDSVDSEQIKALEEKYDSVPGVQMLENDFNQLASLVSDINQRMPIYCSMLENLVELQEEKIINIKLPANVAGFKELNDLNSRFEKMFKYFQFDSEFKFEGFDTGSMWYKVLAVGELSYRYLIAGLKLAQEYLKTRKEYFDSEGAKIDYEASLKESEKYSKEGEIAYFKEKDGSVSKQESLWGSR